ncbi:hypothetical protein QWY84_13865 [Aquisalimonas lutea]|uniref:hypothetical protein n=1 Tax=Aquisalimonas lutea TaxID=1327750 RepID=UPI0025B5BB1C|nr:hypothetical protein [Aquisalimonas lutea]MDN3518702.1 hypothetical protein [Aquisalimonas lutea]
MRSWSRLVIAVLVLIAALAATAFLLLNVLTEYAVERGGSQATGVPVALDGASVSLLQSQLDLDHLVVSNPAGFDTPNLLDLGAGSVAVVPGSFMDDTFRVRHVRLDGLKLHLEHRNGDSNLDAVLEHIRASRGADQDGGSRGTDSGEATSAGSGRTIAIDALRLTDVTVTLQVSVAGEPATVDMTMDSVRLENIRSDTAGEDLAAELSGVILQAVLTAVAEHGGEALPAGIGAFLSGLAPSRDLTFNRVGDTTVEVSGIGGEGVEAVRDALEGAGDELEGALEDAEQELEELF